MIKYTLKCSEGHVFDSWFKSVGAYEDLLSSGHLSCATCGSADVQKAMMTPQVQAGRPLSVPETEAEAALAKMRKHVEENSTYVGDSFVTKAREMHEGTAPEKPIWGEAKMSDAKALIDDGVPVAPLPFMPSRKAN